MPKRSIVIRKRPDLDAAKPDHVLVDVYLGTGAEATNGNRPRIGRLDINDTDWPFLVQLFRDGIIGRADTTVEIRHQ